MHSMLTATCALAIFLSELIAAVIWSQKYSREILNIESNHALIYSCYTKIMLCYLRGVQLPLIIYILLNRH